MSYLDGKGIFWLFRLQLFVLYVINLTRAILVYRVDRSNQ
jgi:hypothetical protein